MTNQNTSLICVLTPSVLEVVNVMYVTLRVESTGYRAVTFCLTHSSSAALLGEPYKGLSDTQVAVELTKLQRQGLQLVIAADTPSFNLASKLV